MDQEPVIPALIPYRYEPLSRPLSIDVKVLCKRFPVYMHVKIIITVPDYNQPKPNAPADLLLAPLSND
jgi:hypothetical protein